MPCPVAPETGATGQPLTCGNNLSASSRKRLSFAPRSSIRSHLPSAMTRARPSRAAKSAIVRSCFSKGIVESTNSTTTSEKRTARKASAAESFSNLSTTLARFLNPAVSKSLIARPRQLKSTPIESRVIPASGPVRRRSSPKRRLIRVDLPAFGLPTTVILSGLVISRSLPSSLSSKYASSISCSSSSISAVSSGSAIRRASYKSLNPSPCSAEKGMGSPSPSV